MVNPPRLAPGDPAPVPLQALPEAELLARWGGRSEPLVSILCPTYQHAPYIADALNGFLAQLTDFPFEVLVRDDASTDGTAQVIADFARRYPVLVRAVLETENDWPLRRAAFVLQPMSRGRFLAFCEGDDYWTDPHHLSVLVAALQEHPDASVVCAPSAYVRDGRVEAWYELREQIGDRLAVPHFPGIPLAALCARNMPVPVPPMQHRIASLDRYHLSTWASAGRLQPVPDAAPTVYRLHSGGSWSPLSARESGLKAAESYVWIAQWWRDQGDPRLAREFDRAAIARLVSALPEAGMVARRRMLPTTAGLATWLARRAPRLHGALRRLLGRR